MNSSFYRLTIVFPDESIVPFLHGTVYQLRLELKQISKESIRQYVLEGKDPQGKTGQQIHNPFEWISDSYEANPMKLRTALRRGETVSVEKLNNKVR